MNSLKTYRSKVLTEAEALLTQYYEKKQEKVLKAQQEKLNEKRFLEIHSRALNSLPDAAPVVVSVTAAPSNQDVLHKTDELELSEVPDEKGSDYNLLALKQKDEYSDLLQTSKMAPNKTQMSANEDFGDGDSGMVRDDDVDEGANQGSGNGDNKRLKKVKPTFIEERIHVLPTPSVPTVPIVAPVGGGRIAKRQRPLVQEGGEESISNTTVSRPNELFTPSGILLNKDWNPKLKPQIKSWALSNFSLSGNQTLAINLTVPRNFRRWSLNICPVNHKDFSDILFHFNPRYNKNRGEHMLVMNDKHGTWGAELRSPFIANDPLSAGAIILMIQIRPEGFCIFANGKFRAIFRHRRDVDQFPDLQLLILDKDENGVVEEAVFHKIWWGRRDLSLDAVPTNIISPTKDVGDSGVDIGGGVGMDDADEIDSIENRKPHIAFDVRTIVATGLPVVDVQGIQFLEHRLEEAFQEFGLETISIVVGKGLGYLRFSSPSVIKHICDEFQDAELRVSEAEASQTCFLKLSPMTEFR